MTMTDMYLGAKGALECLDLVKNPELWCKLRIRFLTTMLRELQNERVDKPR